MADLKKIHTEALERFRLARDADSHNKSEAVQDLRFLWNIDNCQWSEEAKRIRANRPMITENRLPQFVRQVVNDARRNKPSIKVIPADGKASFDVAEILGGMVRHIEQRSCADIAYDNALEFAVSCSRGYFEICTEYADEKGFDQEIVIKPIGNPLTVYDDPNCKMMDNSDRDYCFVSEMVDKDEFKAKWGFIPSDFDDCDKEWVEDDRVRIAKYWKKVKTPIEISLLSDGSVVKGAADTKKIEELGVQVLNSRKSEQITVECYLVTGDRAIEEYKWAGKYIPVVFCPGSQTNVEGKKYTKSLIRDAKESQKVNNYMLSAEVELSSLQPKNPYIGPKGAFDSDAEKWTKANIENYPFIEYDGPTPPTRLYPAPPPQHIIAARQAIVEGMKAIIGMYDASLGARSNEVSGVAIEARAKQGDVATFHFIDNMTRAIRYAGLVIVDLIPKIYDSQRIVRILGPDGEAEMRAINDIMTSLDVGRYDVIVIAGPSMATQRQEARQAMIELIGKYPQMAQVAGDLVVKNMDFPQADELAERIKRTIPPQILGEEAQQQPQPTPEQIAAQADAQKEQMKAQVTLKTTSDEISADMQKTDAQIQSNERIALMKEQAETSRLQMKLQSEREQRESEQVNSVLESFKQMGEQEQKQPIESKSLENIEKMLAAQLAPKRIIFDDNGTPVGIETVQ